MHQVNRTDAAILLALSENARLSGAEIAQRLGLSRNTVQSRLARLESSDALGRHDQRVRPRSLGYPITAFVTVRVEQQKLAAIERALRGIREVTEVHGLAGDHDLLIRVAAVDTEDLYRIAGAILAVQGVERTEVAISMREMVMRRSAPLLEALTQQPEGSTRIKLVESPTDVP